MRDDAPLSARNHRIQELRRLLGRRSARSESGQFVIEGPVLAGEAVSAGLDVEAVFVDVRFHDRHADRLGELTRLAAMFDVSMVPVVPGVLQNVGSTVTPQPVLAIARRCDRDIDDLVVQADGHPILVLAGVGDPGNAGTLVRSAEAAGAGGVVFAGDSVEAFNPKVVRSSGGSLFRLPVTVGVDTAAALDHVASAGYTTVGTAPAGGIAYDSYDLTRPVALVLGNEAHGLPAEIDVDAELTIPIEGATESLNVAMAGTILCFEAARQRRHEASS